MMAFGGSSNPFHDQTSSSFLGIIPLHALLVGLFTSPFVKSKLIKRTDLFALGEPFHVEILQIIHFAFKLKVYFILLLIKQLVCARSLSKYACIHCRLNPEFYITFKTCVYEVNSRRKYDQKHDTYT